MTIRLTSNLTSSQVASAWPSSITINSDPKIPTMVLFEEDPLALAVSMYEYTPNDGNTYLLEFYSSAEDDTTSTISIVPSARGSVWKPTVTEQHRSQAEKIRTYYKGKFLMLALSSTGPTGPGTGFLTEFRKKTLHYLKSDDNKQVDSQILGMIAKLPRMFDEDKIIDSIKDEFNVGEFSTKEKNNAGVSKQLTLTLIASHSKKNGRHSGVRGEFICYWFYDESNRVHLIEMDMHNPFTQHWVKSIEHPINITSKSYPHNARDGLNYWLCDKWELNEN